MISSIVNALTTAITGMATEAGYDLRWTYSTVNPENHDWNSVPSGNYPIVDIYYSGSQAEDPQANTITVSTIATFDIDIIPNYGQVALSQIDSAIRDIKLLSYNNSSLTGTCFFWWVDSAKTFSDQMHDPYFGVRLTIKVRYRELRDNP